MIAMQWAASERPYKISISIGQFIDRLDPCRYCIRYNHMSDGNGIFFPDDWKVKEAIMLEVTESATTQIGEYFRGKTPSPIRIFLNQGG
jgi:hypothetical protein